MSTLELARNPHSKGNFMKIVFLDRKTVGEDLDFSEFSGLGEFVCYDYSAPEEIPERIKDADAVITNKCFLLKDVIKDAGKLKIILLTATGTNTIDKDYLESRGIAWRNVTDYSTDSVAQHTFALLFFLLENLSYYDDYVKSGKYVNDRSFRHFEMPYRQLSKMTWGIIGLGAIGKRVADIAKCFGCRVIYYSTSGLNHNPDYQEVSLKELLETADIVSIHAPINEKTFHLINKETLSLMKNTAILLNVGRGPIIDEKDLAEALTEGTIGGAGLDVLSEEPMREDDPLLNIKDSSRLFITPHVAWAAKETRELLLSRTAENLRKFIEENEGKL